MASISGQEIIKTVNGRLTCYFDGWRVSLPFFVRKAGGKKRWQRQIKMWNREGKSAFERAECSFHSEITPA